MNSFHALFFFIALLLFFISSATPDSFLNPEIRKLTGNVGKTQALGRRHATLENLPDDSYYLRNEETVTISGKVGHQVAVLMDGKNIFESGVRSEYSWEVIWKESSVENVLLGHPKMFQQQHYDDIPDLFSSILLPMKAGRQVVKFREWSMRTGHVRATRTVHIDCRRSSIVFVDNREEIEVHAAGNSTMHFFMRGQLGKSDYKWVIHSSGTSPTLNSRIVDMPDRTLDYMNWRPLQSVTVTPTTAGTNMLKLSYQKGNDILRTSTFTFRVRNESPEYVAAKEAALEAYNAFASKLPATLFVRNETPVHIIGGTVGKEQFILVDGKHRFENQTLNEYVWEPDVASRRLAVGTQILFRGTAFDDVPDMFKIRFIPTKEENEILTLQYIRRRDKHVKATRTIRTTNSLTNVLFRDLDFIRI